MMDLKEFDKWLISEFEFYSQENDFFQNALTSAYSEFQNSKINGQPFEQYYQDDLFERLLCSYKSRLELLLKQIPEPSSRIQLNFLGIDLNSYYDRREYLSQQISRLECRCGGG